MFAIEAGTVVGHAANGKYLDFVSIASAPVRGWNYIHMTPTVAKGAVVKQGDAIGTVVAAPASVNFPTHLHVDAAGAADSTLPPFLRPLNDPLALLDPTVIGDTTNPKIGAVNFMRAEEDNHDLTGGGDTTPASKYKILQNEFPRNDHGYFEEYDFSQARIVGHLAPALIAAPTPVPAGGNRTSR